MSDENPIAKLGDLTKPATVLIEKISDAVGGIVKPYQIVRVAQVNQRRKNHIQKGGLRCPGSLHQPISPFVESKFTKQVLEAAATKAVIDVAPDKCFQPVCHPCGWPRILRTGVWVVIMPVGEDI